VTGLDVEAVVRRWYELWNEQDREGWLAHWRSFAPGEPTLEDPVGTPLKRGWAMAGELWDRTGKDHPLVHIEQLIVGGNEAVVVCRNEGTYAGEPLLIPSVDAWVIRPDGTSSVRSYWQIPPHIPYGVWTSQTGGELTPSTS
jgi:hypothetical protein